MVYLFLENWSKVWLIKYVWIIKGFSLSGLVIVAKPQWVTCTLVLRCSPSPRYLRNAFWQMWRRSWRSWYSFFCFFGPWIFSTCKKAWPTYRLFKNGNRCSRIKCVCFIKIWKSGPPHGLLSMYGLIFFDFLVLSMY